MTRSSSRADLPRVRPVVRLIRTAMALALAFLTMPFLTVSPAYADDTVAAPPDTAVVETTDPPPEPAPAEEPAPDAEEAAPEPEPAPEVVQEDEPAATEGEAEAALVPQPEPQEAPEPESLRASAPETVLLAPLPEPDCTVTDFNQNTQEGGGGSWINGALNQNNSNYAEGDFVPQRVELSGLVPGDYTIGFSFDRTKNGLYAYDYVAGLDIDGSDGASATWSSSNEPLNFDGPAPALSPGGTYTVFVTISFTITATDDPTATLLWTGHIASELDYGPDKGAGEINGAPYHFSLVSTDGEFGCDGGSRDNQLMADAVDSGEITIIKNALPDGPQDFHFTLDAPNALNAAFDLDDDPQSLLPSSVTYRVPPGVTTAAEVDIPDGWDLTGISCVATSGTPGFQVNLAGGTATGTLADNDHLTCTFTNSRASTIEVDKMWVINGGAPIEEGSEPALFGLGAQLTLDGVDKAWDIAHGGYLQGTTVSLDESVTFGNDLCDWADSAVQGRVTEINGDATNQSVPHDVALAGGANHATITNEVTCAGELVLRKVVDNGNGGTAVPGDFTLVASPAGGGADLTTPGSLAGTAFEVTAGATYNLTESLMPAGYSLILIDCGSGSHVTTVQVPAGETRTCTFTNQDTAGTLMLFKVVDDNNTGDGASPDAWTLTATPDGIAGQDPISGTSGVVGAVKAGTYDLGESGGPAGYTPSLWTCGDDEGAVAVTDGSVTVEADQDVVCTITNTAIQPTLRLVKVVDPGDTGDETGASAFTLTATPQDIADQPVLSGAGGAMSIVKVGDYALSETGPSTYAADPAGWDCVAGQADVPVVGGEVHVGLGMNVVCTIVNHAIPSSWMVSKTSDPPSGSTVQPGEQINYTITVTKVGDGVPVKGIDVTDTLTGVEDGWVSAISDGGSVSGGVITWEDIADLGSEPIELTYTVTVGEVWGAKIDNVVTPGPVPCVDVGEVECDHTEHFTPHYTLDKAVALLATPGDGDDLAEPGEQLEYTLTVVNDTAKAVVDTIVTDDLSDVLDNATVVSLGDGLSLDGTTLSWTISDLQPGGKISVSYVVEISAGQWGEFLDNVATPEPDDGGECVPPDDASECATSTPTPEVTTMVIEKRDLETDEVLADATFELWSLGAIPEGGCDFSAEPGSAGQESLGEATTSDLGQALFADLQHGCYLLEETVPPPGYALPADPVLGVQIDEANFVAGGLMAPIVVNDFAEGQLAIVAKRQFELVNGTWVESDGVVGFGDTVRYVVRVSATGPRNFHNIEVTDYVPGFNPADTKSTLDGTLVPGSAKCDEGLTCTVTVDPATQLVTWDIGDLEPDAGVTIGGTAVMDVVFPTVPESVDLAPGETYTAALWNIGFLDWDEAVPELALAGLAGGGAGAQVASAAMIELPMVHHRLVSNEVLVTATITEPARVLGHTVEALPRTGAPQGLLPLGAAAIIVIGAGIGLLRRREE